MPVLIHTLEASFRLLHPFMPFVTEDLWQHLRASLPADWQVKDSIMITTYPEADETMYDSKAEMVVESIIDIVRSIRNARSENKVEMNRLIKSGCIWGGNSRPN